MTMPALADLTPIQQARYAGWLLDDTRKKLARRYASDQVLITQFLLVINQTMTAFDYGARHAMADEAPHGLLADPDLFLFLAQRYQEEIDRINAGPHAGSFKLAPALQWLAKSKRCAIYCAANETHSTLCLQGHASHGSLSGGTRHQVELSHASDRQ